MAWSTRAVAFAAAISFAGTALADEPESVPIESLPSASSSSSRASRSASSPRELGRRWYGWQTLIADGVSLGFLGASAATSDDGSPKLPILGFAAGGYFLGAPIVHFAHRHVVRGLVSLAMRTVPWGIYALAASGSSDRCSLVTIGPPTTCNDGFVVTTAAIAVLTVPAAITIDAAVLARDDGPRTAATGFSPTFVLRRDRAMVGVGGAF